MSSSLRWPGTSATGIGKVPAVLARLETNGPGPSFPVPAASTRMPMSASSSISLTISSAVSPSRMTRSGVMRAIFFARCSELVERGVCCFLLLCLHDVGDAEPLLIAVARFDNAQHHDLRFGAAGALGRPIDRPVAFLGVVNDDEIFALVAGLVAAALAAHGRDAPVRSYARSGCTSVQWWHGGRRADKAGVPRCN